jgi:serine/threonine protein phosphatase PrpC
MAQQIVAFSLPKIGEAKSTNQDRYDRSNDGRLIALADGAGSSLYPGQWAEILVKSFCQATENPIPAIQQSHHDWLTCPQAEWRRYYLEKLQAPNRKWWQGGSEQKACGFSTFLGLRLDRSRSKTQDQQTQHHHHKWQWQAVAIGDSCLFKLDIATQQLSVFPNHTAQTFKRTTQCFASLPEFDSFVPQFIEGECQVGDIFLLATDALSHWLLSDYEQQGDAWQQWFGIKTAKDFARAVTQLRHQQLIQNDDTTLVLLEVGSEHRINRREPVSLLERKPNLSLQPNREAQTAFMLARAQEE